MTQAAIVITSVTQGASARGGLERVAGVLNKLAEGDYAGIENIFAIARLDSLNQSMEPEGLLALTADWPLTDIGALHGAIAEAANGDADVFTHILVTQTIQSRSNSGSKVVRPQPVDDCGGPPEYLQD